MHVIVVAAHDGEAVERQVVQEVHEALLEPLEVTVVRDEVIVVDVGDDRDERLQVRERRIALVRLGDEIMAGTEARPKSTSFRKRFISAVGIRLRLSAATSSRAGKIFSAFFPLAAEMNNTGA